MFDGHINGGRKVHRKPSLSVYDSRKPPTAAADPAYNAQFNSYLDSDAGRGHAAAKAELVAFGVNGEVPLAQARVNAGLDGPERKFFKRPDPGLGEPKKKFSETFSGVKMLIEHFFPGANDNTKSAAIAA